MAKLCFVLLSVGKLSEIVIDFSYLNAVLVWLVHISTFMKYRFSPPHHLEISNRISCVEKLERFFHDHRPHAVRI